MIQMRTWLTVADNSGARKLTCIMPVGGDAGLQAGLGDVITPGEGSDTGKPGKKGKRSEGRCGAHAKRAAAQDGTYIRFDDNAAVLINDAGEPVGTRVFGPVARELREKKFTKIVSAGSGGLVGHDTETRQSRATHHSDSQGRQRQSARRQRRGQERARAFHQREEEHRGGGARRNHQAATRGRIRRKISRAELWRRKRESMFRT